MRIAVCQKYVPDQNTVEGDSLTGKIDERRLLYITNPADASALELALRLTAENGEVSALSVGPRLAERVLRDAAAAGAKQVLRLWADSWETTDPFRTATLLAEGLRVIGLPDMAFCGARSSDRGTGQVPALLAEILAWPVVTDVTSVAVAGTHVVVQRRLSRGAREVVEVRLPAVIGLERDLARLRYASLPNLMVAQEMAVPVLSPDDLGLSARDLQFPMPVLAAVLPPRPRPRSIFVPDSALTPHERIGQILSAGVQRKSGQLITGSPEQLATAIAGFLKSRGLVSD